MYLLASLLAILPILWSNFWSRQETGAFLYLAEERLYQWPEPVQAPQVRQRLLVRQEQRREEPNVPSVCPPETAMGPGSVRREAAP